MPIVDIVDAISNSSTVWRTLHGIEPLCHDGRAVYVTGNAAVVFTVKHEGRTKMLKCYTRPNPYLKEIYGEAFHPREFCIIAITGHSIWIDCLLYERIEGCTLDNMICRVESPSEAKSLAEAFDKMAYRLLTTNRTHGDLKPENIIVTPYGEMVPIDFDSAFVPSLAGRPSVEIGTAAYQHPKRDFQFFDNHLDDYSIAVISTALHSSAIDFSIIEHYRKEYEFPLKPCDILSGKCEQLERYIEEFARCGDALHYRMARMLYSPWPRLFNLKPTLSLSYAENLCSDTSNASLEQENGLWGCRNHAGWIIPPLYDSGFEPSEGFMVATLGGYTHLLSIDEHRVVYSFAKGVTAKPVENGQVVICHSAKERQSIPLITLLPAKKPSSDKGDR